MIGKWIKAFAVNVAALAIVAALFYGIIILAVWAGIGWAAGAIVLLFISAMTAYDMRHATR